MDFFTRSKPTVSEVKSLLGELNQLQTRVEALELASAERQIAVMNAVEKVLNQLRARERKRAEENPSEDAPGPTIMYPPGVGPRRHMRGW